jgi:hypothetical protein
VRIALAAVIAAVALPAAAAEPTSRDGADPLTGCWLMRTHVGSDLSGWRSFCFGGGGVGSFGAFDAGDGWEYSFRYEAKNDRLRYWDGDPQDASVCEFGIEGTSLRLSKCGDRGIFELKCKSVFVNGSAVYCPRPAQ